MQGKLESPHSAEPADRSPAAEDSIVDVLSELLAPERVACNVTARSKKHCLEILSRLLTNDQDSLTYSEVFETIYQRERLGSTCLGQGFALPHGRVEELDQSVGAVLMLTTPVDFDVEQEDGVDLIFALAVPENSDQQHLDNLSAIARMLGSSNLRDQVADIRSSTELHEALLEIARSADSGSGEASQPAGD